MSEMLTPEHLAEQGKKAYEQEDFEAAAEAFQAAEAGFQGSGDAVMAAEMANNRSVVLLRDEKPEAALEAVQGTDRVFEEAGDKRRQAMALGNKAAALADGGQKEEAEKLYWEAARLFDDIGEKELRASVMQSISRLQMGKGRFLEAIASMEAGIDSLEKPSFSQRMVKKLLKIPGNLMNR